MPHGSKASTRGACEGARGALVRGMLPRLVVEQLEVVPLLSPQRDGPSLHRGLREHALAPAWPEAVASSALEAVSPPSTRGSEHLRQWASEAVAEREAGRGPSECCSALSAQSAREEGRP